MAKAETGTATKIETKTDKAKRTKTQDATKPENLTTLSQLCTKELAPTQLPQAIDSHDNAP